MVSFTTLPLYAQDRRLGGPQNLSERYGEEKNFLPLPGNEPRYRLLRNAVPICQSASDDLPRCVGYA
jgi:hypothetical protein